MDLFNRLWYPSLQRAPTVKVEEHSDDLGPPNARPTNHLREVGEQAVQLRDNETQNHDSREIFGEGGELGGEEASNSATSRGDKPKKKKKPKKRKSKEITEDMEVETPQDDNSLEENSVLNIGGQSLNGHIESPSVEEEHMEELPAKKPVRSKGTVPKRNRVSKARAAVQPEEDAGAGNEEGVEAATVANAAPNPRKTVKYFKPRRSQDPALVQSIAEPEIVRSVDAESMNKDTPIPDLSELPQRIKKPKKSKTKKYLEEPTTEPQNDHDDSVHSPLASDLQTDIEPDTQDANLAASSQLQRDAQSVAPPESADGEDAEQEEPKRPSKKALGKRKAVDEPMSWGPSKKSKRGKDNGPQGRDLRAMGFLPSDGASSIAETARKLWEADNRTSPDPASTANSQSSIKSPKSSWNAINNPVDPDGGDESDQDLFVSSRKETESQESEKAKSNVRKRHLRADEPGHSISSPSIKPRPAPVKSKSKTPKTPKANANGVRATPLTKGKLSADEIDAISSAVESYRELCNLNQYEMNELIQSDAQMKVAQDMWKSICDEVPQLPRRSVQNTCRRKFHNFEARGAWTEEQDDQLQRAYDEHPGKWKLIGETLNRFPEDVRDRWRNYLVCGDTLKKDVWDMEEEEHLRRAVKKCVKAAREKYHWGENQGTLVDEDSFMDWQKVSELMGRTRSRLQCRNKWKKLIDREEVFVDDPVAKMPISESWRLEEAALQARTFSAEEKLTLLRAIRDSGAAREGKIPWQTIKDDLNGQGKRMAWKYCFRKLKAHVPDHENMEFKDIVVHLVDVFEAAAPNEPDGYDLPIEAFAPYVTPNKRKTKPDGNRGKEDEGEASTPKKRKSRARKRNQDHASDAEIAEVSMIGRRTLRGRMLKEGESQATSNSQGDSVNTDIGEDVVQSFQAIKRTPKPAGKRVIRKSKRNKALSEEKVVEDLSDDEVPLLVRGNGDEMDVDHEETYTTTGGPVADDEEFDNKASYERSDDVGYYDLAPDLTNAYHTEGSPDLDTPVAGRTFKRLGSPFHTNGYRGEDESGDVSSDEGSVSDIPATRQPRLESVEL